MTLSASALESSMPHYAALDVSNDGTVLHVLDEVGRIVWRGKWPSAIPVRHREPSRYGAEHRPDAIERHGFLSHAEYRRRQLQPLAGQAAGWTSPRGVEG